MDMAATHAVMNTTELLVQVLAHQIPLLKGVSKTWKSTITSSPRVRKARCLVPTHWKINYRSMTTDSIPVYDGAYDGPSPIQLHPVFGELQRLLKTGNCNSWFHEDKTERSSMDYATTPRCQAVHVTIQDVQGKHLSHCVVYVKEGVKIGDILGVSKALRTTYEKCSPPNTFMPEEWMFHITWLRKAMLIGRDS